jgi:heptosyltransferase II
MKKFLVIQTAFIGDAILTLPMIQKLKEKTQQCEIHVLTIPSTSEIFSASPYVSRVIVIDKKGKHKSFNSLLKFIKELKKNNYNRIYSPHRSFRSTFITMMLGVKETFGFSNTSLRHVYKNLIEYRTDHHEVQRNLDLINFGYKNDEWKISPEIRASNTIKEKIIDFVKSNHIKKDLAVIAPGSVWNTKKYPAENFEEIISYLIKKDFFVLLIGSEKEKNLCEKISLKFNGSVVSAAGIFSLIETVELLKKARILISNDSAPTHLGMCADIPVLTIYCSTVPEFGFYPYNKRSQYVSYDNLSCKPCGIHGYGGCPLKHFACGNKLNSGVVISKIEEILND